MRQGDTMKLIITILVAFGIFFTGIPKIESQNKPETSVYDMVTFYAEVLGVDKDLAHYIASEESQYNPQAIGDMDITCKRTGLPVRARGVFQITDCWYPQVTDDMAFDSETNIHIAMKIIAQGEKTCRSQFSTCERYYAKIEGRQ